MTARRVVRIDALTDGAWRCDGYDAVICIDVLLSTTTVVTAAAMGRRVFPVATPLEAARLQMRLTSALVVTDGLEQPADAAPLWGPAELSSGTMLARTLVHLSPLAEMLAAMTPRATVYVACLRNLEATARAVAQRHRRVAIIGAGEAGEICTEDQMAAARLRTPEPEHRDRGRALGRTRRLAGRPLA
jgi:phosphosulfolactate phosphohydrolase-like enzyme